MINNITSYPELRSKDTLPKRLIVFLHGLGSDGHDLIGIAPFFQNELPDAHFISPHGVQPYDMGSYGRQWFSLANRQIEVLKQQLIDNIPLLAKIIEKKQEELNLTNKETIIIGFSQGTMMALYLNLIQVQPFLGIVGLSGRLFAPKICTNKSTPICLIHGEMDTVVDIEAMNEATKYLASQNITHITHKIPNLAHSIDAKGIEFAINFIKSN